jgi:hypothetical protein
MKARGPQARLAGRAVLGPSPLDGELAAAPRVLSVFLADPGRSVKG